MSTASTKIKKKEAWNGSFKLKNNKQYICCVRKLKKCDLSSLFPSLVRWLDWQTEVCKFVFPQGEFFPFRRLFNFASFLIFPILFIHPPPSLSLSFCQNIVFLLFRFVTNILLDTHNHGALEQKEMVAQVLGYCVNDKTPSQAQQQLHTCLTIGTIQLFISFYLIKSSMQSIIGKTCTLIQTVYLIAFTSIKQRYVQHIRDAN